MTEQQNTPEIRFSEFKSGWKKDKLGTLIKNNTILNQSDGNHGSLYPRNSEFINSGIPYISASNIKNNEIDFSNVKYLEMERAKQFKKGVAQNEDVLLAHNATVGPTALLKTEYPFVILSTTLTLYRLNKDKVNNHYFLYSLQSKNIQNQLTKLMKQTTRNQVPILLQRTMILTYPRDLEEQEKIGNFFRKLDRQIELEEKKLELLEQQKRGYMQKIFSQKLRFKDENGDEYPEWKSKKLKDIANVYQPQNLSQNNFQKKGYPVYGANGVIGYYKDFNHSNMEIAVACRGNTCGRVNLTEPKSWITSNAMVVDIIDEMEIEFYFLYQYLRIINYSNVISGSGQPQITRKNMNSVELLVPNYIEQQKIGNLFRRFDDFIEKQSQKIDLLKERKKGFLQKMFI